MQRPDRRQVRNLRHAKPLTGIVAELPLEGQHPHPAKDNIASACSPQPPVSTLVVRLGHQLIWIV